MRMKRLVYVSMLFLLTFLAIGILVAFTNPHQNDQASTSDSNLSNVQGTTLALQPPSTIPIKDNGKTILTSQDVTQYLQTHLFAAGPTTTGKPPTIELIQLLTDVQASKKIGSSVGLPNNAPVYYVLLRGPFIPVNVKLPPSEKPIGNVDEGWEIFDAYAGNLLVWGLI